MREKAASQEQKRERYVCVYIYICIYLFIYLLPPFFFGGGGVSNLKAKDGKIEMSRICGISDRFRFV